MRSVVSFSVVNLSCMYPTKPDLVVFRISRPSMPPSTHTFFRLLFTEHVRRSVLPPTNECACGLLFTSMRCQGICEIVVVAQAICGYVSRKWPERCFAKLSMLSIG